MLATGLDIGSGFRPPYTEMKLLKLATVMLGLAIFLVNTGDCVNLAFADAKASDCCLKEDCPLAPTSRMDSCCTTPASPSGKYLERPARPARLTQPLVAIADFPANAINLGGVSSIGTDSLTQWQSHAPPGDLHSPSIPLRI